jgi:hypothetical protein
MQRVTWRVVRLPKNAGYAGEITIPDRLGHLHSIKSTASTKEKAINKASSLASKLLNDPMVMSALPPGAAAAVQAVSKIASNKYVKAGLKHLKFW